MVGRPVDDRAVKTEAKSHEDWRTVAMEFS